MIKFGNGGYTKLTCDKSRIKNTIVSFQTFILLNIFSLNSELMEMLQPDLIAPVVAWLCHEDCKDNGAIVEAAGGWAGKCESYNLEDF